jgi:hypothetical protein
MKTHGRFHICYVIGSQMAGRLFALHSIRLPFVPTKIPGVEIFLDGRRILITTKYFSISTDVPLYSHLSYKQYVLLPK